MIKLSDKKRLKFHLIRLLNKEATYKVFDMNITLKESKLGPNLKIFFNRGGTSWHEYIFLSDWKYEKSEEEYFDILIKAESIKDLLLSEKAKYESSELAFL